MFVFLHLNAAVINTLDAAQAQHLLVDAQTLESTQLITMLSGQILSDVTVKSLNVCTSD